MLKKNLTIDDFPVRSYVNWDEIKEVMGKRRYKKFVDWMAGQTVPIICDKCWTSAVYPCDLKNYLRKPEDRFFD